MAEKNQVIESLREELDESERAKVQNLCSLLSVMVSILVYYRRLVTTK